MKYAIKLRCFPPADQYQGWETLVADEEALHECVWDFGEEVEYSTEYMRPVVDERMRNGFSCKLIVETDSDLPPENWDWAAVAELDADRVEFVRATPIEDPTVASDENCYTCNKALSSLHTWRDEEGDGYCSRKCVEEILGKDAYMVSPGGRVHNKEEES